MIGSTGHGVGLVTQDEDAERHNVRDDPICNHGPGPLLYDEFRVPEGVTPSNRRGDGLDMTVGDLFESKDDFDMKVSEAAVAGDYQLKRPDSKKHVLDFRCLDEACEYRACARQVRGSSLFQLRHYNKYHTCGLRLQTLAPRNCTAKFIATKMKERFSNVKKVPGVDEVARYCQFDLNAKCTSWKAWDAHRKAKEMVWGDEWESYGEIPGYLWMVKELNPDSVVDMSLDSEGRFQYCFVALGACIRGFQCMRPVVIIDAAFLKTKHKGQLVSAICTDNERHVYPIAWGIIDVECNAAWGWFLQQLRNAIPDRPGLVFVSDRHQAIKNAIAKEYPTAFHAYCYFHLKGNLSKLYPNQGWGSVFYSAAYAPSVAEFSRYFEELESNFPTVSSSEGRTIAQYLKEVVGIPHWSLAHCPQRRYEIMTSNHVECFNATMRKARKLPPIQLLDHALETTNTWFCTHRNEGQRFADEFTPSRNKLLCRNFKAAKSVTCTSLNYDVYQTRSRAHGDHQVDLNLMQCTCCRFQIDEIPCVHACAAAKTGERAISLMSPYYSSAYFRKAYSETIYTVANREQWDRSAFPAHIRDMECKPPEYAKSRGRPQTTRRPSQGENVMKMRRNYSCKGCDELDHSKKYCPTQGQSQN